MFVIVYDVLIYHYPILYPLARKHEGSLMIVDVSKFSMIMLWLCISSLFLFFFCSEAIAFISTENVWTLFVCNCNTPCYI